ncbi:STAS domain-containing protein [Streptosporangium vulgare]|uniref:Anti-sigma factor antagonist n=1 Tax=Streptosporangium vulgare TaxID=46190 RepID=A0ABV5T6X4_9ACTN
MTTRLDLSVRRHEGASVIAIAGELDKLSSPRLRDVMVTQLDDGSCHLVLDVTCLRFCDSTGLWTMLEFRRRAGAAGGCLRLAGVHGVLERILTITGLAGAFFLDPDVPTSLRAMSSFVPATKPPAVSPPTAPAPPPSDSPSAPGAPSAPDARPPSDTG